MLLHDFLAIDDARLPLLVENQRPCKTRCTVEQHKQTGCTHPGRQGFQKDNPEISSPLASGEIRRLEDEGKHDHEAREMKNPDVGKITYVQPRIRGCVDDATQDESNQGSS